MSEMSELDSAPAARLGRAGCCFPPYARLSPPAHRQTMAGAHAAGGFHPHLPGQSRRRPVRCAGALPASPPRIDADSAGHTARQVSATTSAQSFSAPACGSSSSTAHGKTGPSSSYVPPPPPPLLGTTLSRLALSEATERMRIDNSAPYRACVTPGSTRQFRLRIDFRRPAPTASLPRRVFIVTLHCPTSLIPPSRVLPCCDR